MAKVTLYLHGRLKHFKQVVTVDVATYSQLVGYLCRAFKGMRAMLKAGVFRFALSNERASSLMSSSSNFQGAIPDGAVLHLVPIEGIAAKKAMAIIGLVVGVVMIATGILSIQGAMVSGASFGAAAGTTVAFGISAAAFIGAGVSLAMMSATALMAPTMEGGDLGAADEASDRQSKLFTSASNRVAKGVALPVCYGRFLCGSNVISQSIETIEVL